MEKVLENGQFKDAEFMTAGEKRLVLKNWERFVRNRFQWKDFTDRIYNHLTLHCSFMAHYDRRGFYATYFDRPEMTLRFLKQFDREEGAVSVECGGSWWLTHYEYSDINNAMCGVVERFIPLYKKLLAKQARDRDLAVARQLLSRHGIQVPEEGVKNGIEVIEMKADVRSKGVFPRMNKQETLEDCRRELERKADVFDVRISHLVIMDRAAFENFSQNLLSKYDWLAGKGGTNSEYETRYDDIEGLVNDQEEFERWKAQSYDLVLMVVCEGDVVFVDPQGYDYARYVGFPIGGR